MPMISGDDLQEIPLDPDELASQQAPLSGTVDDDGDHDDERDDENEAPVRERSDRTETRDEFQLDEREEEPESTDEE
jgi:hypothetical protein